MGIKAIGYQGIKPVTIANGLRHVVLLTEPLYANLTIGRVKSHVFKFFPTREIA